MTKNMTTGRPMLLMLQFALPIFIGNLFQQLYNVVDTMIVGRLLGVNALAAVGSTGSLNFAVIGLVIGMTSGFGVMMSQSFGAGDEQRLRRYVVVAAELSLILAVMMTVVLSLMNGQILRWMNSPAEIYEDTKAYIGVIYAGLAASFLYNLLAAIARAMGDSRTPLYFLVLSSVLNIVLDYVLIAIIPLGVAGAAVATVTSQAISGILCLFYIRKKYTILRLTKEDLRFSVRYAADLLQMGIPMALQFSITAFGTIIVSSALNLLGPVYIAGFSTANKVQNVVTQIFPAIGLTVATFTGQNRGAGKLDRVRQGVREAWILVLFASILCLALVYFGGDMLIQLFVSGEEQTGELIAASRQMFHTCMWFYLPLGTIFIFRNALQGLGYALIPMLGGVFELFARGLGTVLLAGPFGYAGICFTDPLAWMSALIPLIPYYFIQIRKLTGSSKPAAE